MRNQIIAVINSMPFKLNLIASAPRLIQGGYELYLRNLLIALLRESFPQDDFRSEFPYYYNGRVALDIVKVDQQGRLCDAFDLSHNGTFQVQSLRTGVANKTRADINKYIARNVVSINTLSILTDIKSVHNLNLLHHYVGAITRAIKSPKLRADRIAFVTDYLNELNRKNGNTLFHTSFPIVTPAFSVEPHFFVSGEFTHPV